jgi:hypothetical protein
MMTKLALGVAGVASAGVTLRFPDLWSPPTPRLTAQDDEFLEQIARQSFEYFRTFAHPQTGMVKDVGRLADHRSNTTSSIAATGFGLTALCIGEARGWLTRPEALERVRRTLRFLDRGLAREHGFFYHFVDWQTGKRAGRSEVSSIDTAILICGALTCRQHFADAEITEQAGKVFDRVDWQWMFGTGPFLRHGWTPERGFLAAKWDEYSEHMMLYLLALGANQNPIPAQAWQSWRRPVMTYGDHTYIDTAAPLFIHQYSHAWFDFRGQRDDHADYHQNSVLATLGHREFCKELQRNFPHYSDELWGITASSSPRGYVVWGGPPRLGPIDGTVVPCAVGGSIPFLRQETLAALRHMRERFGGKIWTRLGFADAFNPMTGWVARDFVGINTGITLLMAENARSGLVWDMFMRNPEAQRGMARAGFRANLLG